MQIVKVPGINGLGKTNGCEDAPKSIMDNLCEIHSNEKGKSLDINKLNLDEIVLDNGNLEECNKLIYKKAFETFGLRSKTIFLGGDHSISYSLTQAFFDNCCNSGKEPCLIVMDAHADCMTPMTEPTHEEWLRKLIGAGFPVKNILLVGVRNMWKDEVEFLKKHKIQQININSIAEDIDNIADTIMEFVGNKELYVSIDIDVIDPAFAPATGYPEPGGLSSREFIYLIQRIRKIRNLRAVDLVEINPSKDVDCKTSKLGAKILGELI